MCDLSFKCIGEMSFCTWDGVSIIYNIGSGNTHLIEHVPLGMLDYCFGVTNLKVSDEKSLNSLILKLNNEYDIDYLSELLNRFITMGLLEEIG